MDFDLSDEQKLIRDTAREFTDKEVVPRARENDRNNHFDTELVRKIADQGYLGAIVPREYGGAGLDYLTYALVVEEVGRGCSAMRTVDLGPDVAGVLVDRALGLGGAEAALAPAAVLGRVARLLRADRARHRLRRRQPAHAREEGRRRLGDHRQQDVDLARQPRRGRADLRPDRPGEGAPRARRLPRPDQERGLLEPGDPREDGPARLRHRRAHARRRARRRRRADGRGRRRLQDRDERAGLGALLRRRGLRRHLPGLARRLGRLRQGARAVRAPDRVVPARAGDDRRHARADRRRAHARLPRRLPEGPGPARRPPRPRSPSSTRPRRRRTARTSRSRSTAARATSTTTRSSATTATCA